MSRAALWTYFVLCAWGVAWGTACLIVYIADDRLGMVAAYSLPTGLNLFLLAWVHDKLRHPDGGAA